MTDEALRAGELRGAGLAGLAGAALFLAGFGLLATPPTPAQPAGEIAGYLHDHRGAIFAATILIGLGSALFAWYLAGLRRLLGGVAVGALDLAAVIAASMATLLVLVALSLLSGLVLHRPGAELSRLGFDVFNALVTMGGFGFGFSLIAVAVAGRGGALPPAYRIAGFAIGALQLATIPGLFVGSGPLAPLGPVALLAFWLLTAWYAAVALRMLRSAGRAGSGPP